MRLWSIALFIISSSLSATPLLPLPDVLVYGLAPSAINPQQPVNSSWTVSYAGQVLSDLPIDFFDVAGVTYYVAAVPSVYSATATAPANQLLVSATSQPLSIAFQSVGDIIFPPDLMHITVDYSLAKLGVIQRLDLINADYQTWLHATQPTLPTHSLVNPYADSDGDGFTNEAEFLAGTDPYHRDIFPGMHNRDWWIKRGVIDTSLPSHNYSLVALGQLKNMAVQGLAEVREQYPEIAPLIEADLQAIFNIQDTATPNNLEVANIGQLKAVSAPFYEHLNLPKPWTQDRLLSNKELAALGQLKHLFDFPINSQADFTLDYTARRNDSTLLIQSFPDSIFTQQDFGAIHINADGVIHLDGNTWKLLEFPNGPNPHVTGALAMQLNPSHVLSFEFKKAGPVAEIYAIGLFHPDSNQFSLVAFGGTQSNHQLPTYNNQSVEDEHWRKLVIPIGQFAQTAGTLDQLNGPLMLALVIDADNVSGTHAYFRNIRLIDFVK